ncbi:hypothetical protein DAPPUDRAFT_229745 [Daphnia pulex]|uniref:Uncharacterized protein n=1 Tax=Daphnia pulex TaxID=6669 RepID=E9HTW7_DAPPU|nr:hypothetical protein DAPPUDRAFT_229745 [Daphnia pulex]|eukprot:EFX64816.1 hypothetical protein DAPPUDRAFT_229745 [Daphnia pulex]
MTYFGIQTESPLTGARRSHKPDTFHRAANRQSPYPKRGRTWGRGSDRHVSHCNIVGHDKKDCGNKQSGLPRHSENEYYSNFKAKDKGNVADQSSNAVPESSYIAGLTLFDSRLLPRFGRNATHHFT